MNVTSPMMESSIKTHIDEAHALIGEKAFTDAIECLTPVVKAMKLSQPRPDEIFALLMMADAQRFNDQPADAYKNYVIASELDPKQLESLEEHTLHCISKMREPIISPIFEQHLIKYFHHRGLENTAVDRVSVNLLKHKFNLDDENATLEFSEILSDDFLLEALSQLVLADPTVEVFLKQLRQQVFTLAIETDLADELQLIVIALANHAERVEYAYPIDDSERVVLLGIKTLLETEVENEAALEQHLGALLLYAMYEPVNDLSCCRGLSYSKFEDWPTALQPLLKKVFLDRATEHALADSINRLDSVTHEVSKAVMNLYEQNPYPRWEHIFLTENKIRYIDLYPNLTKLIRNRKKFNKHISCLIAGAGTGRQPLWLAANCHDIDVLAFDLSLPSLCYAKRQSMELGLRNIEFCQGDILNLGQLEKKFDVIECSGVLHHMQDPEAGLRILVQRLRSNGLLRLGLYSRIARERTGITAARVDKPNATLEDIRETRAFHLNNGGKLLNLSRDFYTASECRDLLFHVQERQYDIPELKSLLDRNDLEFLGFSPLPKEIDTAFQNRFGPNPDYLDLDNWHLFETENPLIFKGMYQFHCQKRK